MSLQSVTRLLTGLVAGSVLLGAAAVPAFADTPPESPAAAQRPVQDQRRSGLQPLEAMARGTTAALLQIPGRTQLDGSLFQGSNCGVASLSMILLGHGVDVPVVNLRAQANVIQPPGSIDDGLHWDTIAEVARSYGLQTRGVFKNGDYRVWTPAEIRQELAAGNPIITLVHYRALPANQASRARVDHYIVLTGFDGEDFLYNDPLPYSGSGVNMRINEKDLIEAWDAAWPERAAMVVYQPSAPAARLAPEQVGRDPGRVVAQPPKLALAVPPALRPVQAIAPEPRRPAEAPPALATAAIDWVGQMVGAAGRAPAAAGPAPFWGWALAAIALAGLIGLGTLGGRTDALCYTLQLQRVRLPRS